MSRELLSQANWACIGNDVRAFLTRKLHNHSDIDDLVQNVLVAALENGHRFKFVGCANDLAALQKQVSCWVIGFAKNKYKEYCKRIRKERARTSEMGELGCEEIDNRTISPNDWLASCEHFSKVLDAIKGASPALQQIAVSYFQGHSAEEIAKRYSIDIDTAYARISRLKKMIRSQLTKLQLDGRDFEIVYKSVHSDDGIINQALSRHLLSDCGPGRVGMTNYIQYIRNCKFTVEEIRDPLTEARMSLEQLEVDDESRTYATNQLVELTIELQKTEPSLASIRTYCRRIDEAAPPIGAALWERLREWL